MALAVASFTTADKESGNGPSEIETLTLPSGMSNGDLLLFVALGNGFTGIGNYGSSPRLFDPPSSAVPAASTDVPAGFSLAGGFGYRFGQGSLILSDSPQFVWYKIVDGTETNHSFDSYGYYAFIHITGWNGENVNPVFDKVHTQNDSQYYITPSTDNFPLKRTSQGILLTMGYVNYDTNDASNPTIVGGTNPTWTEIYSFSNFGTGDESGHLFYAVSNEDTDITSFSITNGARVRSLWYIGEPQDATGNTSFLAIDADPFEPQSGSNSSNFSNNFAAYNPELFAQTTTTSRVTQVDNKPKPAVSDLDNLSK